MPVKITHIIGNGSSAKLYVGSGCMNVVACNIPQHGHRYTALSIIDTQPVVWMSNTGWRPTKPVYCSKKTKAAAKKYNIEGDWFDVYDDRHRSNSGHWAALYNARLTTEEIHLWGMDSMWSNEYSSTMDSIVPRPQRPQLNTQWRPFWQEIFEQNTHVRWFIHAPHDAQIPKYADHVIGVNEEEEWVF